MKALYDNSLSYINYLRQINAGMQSNELMHNLLRVHERTGLPLSVIMGQIGAESNQWDKVDKINDVIRRARETLKMPDDPSEDLNEFLDRYKKAEK